MSEEKSKGFGALFGSFIGVIENATGASPFVIKTSLAVGAFLIASSATVINNIERFDKGWAAFRDAHNEAQEDLDDQADEILDIAEVEIQDINDDVEEVVDDYEDQSQANADRMQYLLDEFERNAYNRGNRNEPKTDWGAMPVPDATRLRYQRFNRERENNRNQRAADPVDDQSVLAGSPTAE